MRWTCVSGGEDVCNGHAGYENPRSPAVDGEVIKEGRRNLIAVIWAADGNTRERVGCSARKQTKQRGEEDEIFAHGVRATFI